MGLMPKDVLEMTQHALRVAGLSDSEAGLRPENLIGDDDPRCDGYVQLDSGIDIYPSLVGDDVGWGVSYTACVPGVHTFSNGDPGYPDDYDVVDVAPPQMEVKTIVGVRSIPRSAADAVRLAIEELVRGRLNDWQPGGDHHD